MKRSTAPPSTGAAASGEVILDAAEHLFAVRGYTGVSISEPRDRGVPEPRALATELAVDTMTFTLGLVITKVTVDDLDVHAVMHRVLRFVLLAVDAESAGP